MKWVKRWVLPLEILLVMETGLQECKLGQLLGKQMVPL
jgi:hypothetical protein